MIWRRYFLAFGTLAAITGFLVWLAFPRAGGQTTQPGPGAIQPITFRLGLIPDRNISEQRKANRALADYLEAHVTPDRGTSTLAVRPALHVELVTSSNYAGILKDFADGDVDGAFLGSLVTVLAVDRCGAEVVAKSENQAGLNTYAGVLFVPDDSSIKSLAELRGRKLGAVRSTMAGSIFPIFEFEQMGIDAVSRPERIWSGTHDDVIEEVIAKQLDAGAVKDLRLNDYEQKHAGIRFRRLASGPRVPDNALVVRHDLPRDVRDAIIATLLDMRRDRRAKPVLEGLQLNGFVKCELAEYAPLYDMIESLGPHWSEAGVDGPPPRRPTWAERKAGK